MKSYQQDFLTFAIKEKVLCFGEFTLKSGRISPYFFNAGLFQTGSALSKLATFYAKAIVDSKIKFDVLFGPAYKGIPLVSIIALKLYEQYGLDYAYAFNRKEIKTHGEGGNIIGAKLQGRVLVVDDVITAGTAIKEAAEIVKSHQAELAGITISLDRQEKGKGDQSAIQEIESQFNIPVTSIVGLTEIIAHIEKNIHDKKLLQSIRQYRQVFGI